MSKKASGAWAKVRALGGVGIAVFAVGIFVAGAVAGGLFVNAKWREPPEKRSLASYSEVDEQQAGELAARFRPWLRFDSEERWRPLNVSRMLEERSGGKGAHGFCQQLSHTGKRCEPIEGEVDFRNKVRLAGTFGQASYIDIAGGRLAEYRGVGDCAPLLDCGGGSGSAIYYRVTNSNDRFYVDYWWFLRFNNFQRTRPSQSCKHALARDNEICGEHEGDWEGVTAVTRPGEERELDYVVYAAHSGTFRYAASDVVRASGTRPEVFVARGSHASYPRPCESGCKQPISVRGLVTLPEADFDGGASWERNAERCEPGAPRSCLQPLPRADRDLRAWTVWPGRWGSGCGDVCGGGPGPASPRSPGSQTRYQAPWCSTNRDVFGCDERALGCGDWLGPQVAAVACRLDALTAGQRDAKPARGLALRVRGEDKTIATVPGVVQALGKPLSPGDAVTITSGGPRTQLLVRAQQGRHLVEARFYDMGLAEGERALVTVESGAEAPVVKLDGARVERRFLELSPG